MYFSKLKYTIHEVNNTKYEATLVVIPHVMIEK